MAEGLFETGVPASTFDLVADFVLRLSPDDIPPAALERVELLLLDTLGICAAAAPMEAGHIGRDIARLIFAAGDERYAARMLFDGTRASLAGALYAAATQTDNLDGHDGSNPTKGHIGVVAAPALAVLAQHRPDLGGREALAALVVGYEVAERAGLSLHATVDDYHASGAWNALGVVAMAARLRGCGAEVLRQALGIAEYHGTRSQMMREIATPTMLHDSSGWGGLVGMASTLLAERGFTGAPAITVEAPEVEAHWADLGKRWRVERQYVKPYPVCRWAHAAIDAARRLFAVRSFDVGEIADIRINSFANAVALFPGMPTTTSEAQYSMPFAVATILVHGRIGLEHITGAGLSDPRVATLVARTGVAYASRHEARFPTERWADVEIELTDGTLLTSGDVLASGGPEPPFTREAVLAKYLEFARPALGEARAEALRDAILGLHAPESTFASVAAHLYEPI